MDYTTLTHVKLALGAQEAADDTLLTRLITAASRAIDRKVTGKRNVSDYFTLADVSAETGTGLVGPDGILRYGTRKAVANSVSSLEYRSMMTGDFATVSTTEVSGNLLRGYVGTGGRGSSAIRYVWVRASYNGGFADTADDLPADILEAATVLTVRYYREVKSGLTDTIGVAELGTLAYTSAWPKRVLDMLQPYKTGWGL